MSFSINQVVALCYNGRRVRNVVIKQVRKTYIEIADGSRFSPSDGCLKSNADGSKGFSQYYLDEDVEGWDNRDQQRKIVRELNTAFEELIVAAKNRNWNSVKERFNTLSKMIEE